jgi:hypothetical protein
MKYLNLFENFLNEDSRIEKKVQNDPAFAKKLLKMAMAQYDDEWQESYTVYKNPENQEGEGINFWTLDAALGALGHPPGDGSLDVEVDHNYEVIWYAMNGDPEEGTVGEHDGTLSGATKLIAKALKAAKAAEEKFYND